jgi:hypothetical protein
MKKISKHLLALILITQLSVFLYAKETLHYTNKTAGVTFVYPGILTIDEKSSTETPLSVVFSYGEAPFSVSILFKEVKPSTTLKKFTSQEKKAQKDGNYKNEIEEKLYMKNENMLAIEFIRRSAIGTIYYFVFPSPKTGTLFALWHLTSRSADPDENAVKAYETMRDDIVQTLKNAN